MHSQQNETETSTSKCEKINSRTSIGIWNVDEPTKTEFGRLTCNESIINNELLWPTSIKDYSKV